MINRSAAPQNQIGVGESMPPVPECLMQRQRGTTMQTYGDLVELARICMKQSRHADSKEVAAELRRMAKDYQRRAAELDSGTSPDIGQ
jgi:hypothetical protein